MSPSIREAPSPGYMPTASSHDSSRQQNTRWYGRHPSVPVHCEPDRMICELLSWSGTGSSELLAPKTMRFKLVWSSSNWASSIASSASMLSAIPTTSCASRKERRLRRASEAAVRRESARALTGGVHGTCLHRKHAHNLLRVGTVHPTGHGQHKSKDKTKPDIPAGGGGRDRHRGGLLERHGGDRLAADDDGLLELGPLDLARRRDGHRGLIHLLEDGLALLLARVQSTQSRSRWQR